MDSMIDSQAIKLKCRHCEGSLKERITGLTADPTTCCSTCAAAGQAYADLLRTELIRIDQALTDGRSKLDQALWKEWEILTSPRQ